MTGASFLKLKGNVQSLLTTYGEISVDSCIRQMCDIVIGHGESVTPHQLAELMDISRRAAEHNLEAYDKLIEIAKTERYRRR